MGLPAQRHRGQAASGKTPSHPSRNSNLKPRQIPEREPMANTDDKPALKITLEDLEKVKVRQEPVTAGTVMAAGALRQYGNIATPGSAETPIVEIGRASCRERVEE